MQRRLNKVLTQVPAFWTLQTIGWTGYALDRYLSSEHFYNGRDGERRLLYPIVEIIHILGIIVLVWSAALFDFRLLGLSRQLSVAQLSRYVLPWARLSVLAIVPAGVLMFASNATSLKPGRSRSAQVNSSVGRPSPSRAWRPVFFFGG